VDGAVIASFGDGGFQWTPVAGAVAYDVQWGQTPDPFTEPTLHEGTVPIGPIIWSTDPPTGEAFEWRVRARGADGSTGAWSDVRAFATAPIAPPALLSPANGATVSDPSTLVLTWTPVTYAPMSAVEISRTSDFATVTRTSFLVDGRLPMPLDRGTWYWRVVAERDQLLVVSAARSLEIVDVDAPIGRMVLNGGGAYTESTVLNVFTDQTDLWGTADTLRLSQNGTDWTDHPLEGDTASVNLSNVSPEAGGETPGRRDVYAQWRDDSGNWSPVIVGSVWYLTPPPDDHDAPIVSAPSIAGAGGVIAAGAPSRVAWSATDPGSAVISTELQESIDGGPYAAVPLGSATAMSASLRLPTSHAYRFRVRAVDMLSNRSAWVYGVSFSVSAVSDSNGSVHYAGTWLKRSSSGWSGGRGHVSRVAGSSATYRFTGRAIELVARRIPGFGQAKIYIDGHYTSTIKLSGATASAPTIVYARSWSASGTHTIMIKVVGTVGHPMIDIDGFIVFH
jgi:hypothetical protein